MKQGRKRITRVTQRDLPAVLGILRAANCVITETRTVTRKRVRRGVANSTVFTVIKYREPANIAHGTRVFVKQTGFYTASGTKFKANLD